MTHRGVAVHDRDRARRGHEGFRAHDRKGLVEGHHLAAPDAPGGMHVIVAVRTPTVDEAVLPQLKEGHVHLVATNQLAGRRGESPRDGHPQGSRSPAGVVVPLLSTCLGVRCCAILADGRASRV